MAARPKKLTFGRALVWITAIVALMACDSASSRDGIDSATTSYEQHYWVEEVTTGLNFPWAMTWLPEGQMLITERLGRVRVVRDGRLLDELRGLPAVLDAGLWDGLFDIKLDPDFRENHNFYLTYTDGEARARIGKIFKGRLERNRVRDGQVIFSSEPALSSNGPIMMRIFFLADRTMLVGVGSGDFNPNLVQELDNHIGKIIRLNRDGTAPIDNPFLKKPGALPEIWAGGFRNPSGITEMDDGSLWAVDDGPRGGDELNRLAAGANYGWPLVTWGFDYSGEAVSRKQEDSNFAGPALVWSPSHTPSDLVQYTGTTYPFWNGDLFTGGLSGLSIRRIRVRNGKVVLQERMLEDLNERFRSIQVGPDNLLYLLTDGSAGRLLRLRPGAPTTQEQSRVARPSAGASDLLSVVMKDRVERRARVSNAASRAKYDGLIGKQRFRDSCAGCHRLGEFDYGRVGPNLNGITHRYSGAVSDFDYSLALRDPKTKVAWSKDSLLEFLADPQLYFPGTKMAVPAITDPMALSSLVNFILREDAGQKSPRGM